MRKTKKFLLAGAGAGFYDRALSAVRPGVEAILLAAVALGCAQAGWGVLTPGVAGSAPSEDQQARRAPAPDVRSPFAPAASSVDAASHAAAALLSSVQLAGVRVSTDPSRSGAVLTLADGGQRAFMVGQEIASGVRLAEVNAEYVLLAYDGGQRQLAMSAPAELSFARAMLGQDVGAPTEVLAPSVPQAPAVVATADQAAWLAATLTQIETDAGQARGWRVTAATPAPLLAAGLRPGDLIVAVNGAGPAHVADALGAVASSNRVELSVVRGESERLTITLAAQSPT